MDKILLLTLIFAFIAFSVYQIYRRRKVIYHRPISGKATATDTLSDKEIVLIADVVQSSIEKEKEIRLKINYSKSPNLSAYEIDLSKKEAETLVTILNEAISKT